MSRHRQQQPSKLTLEHRAILRERAVASLRAIVETRPEHGWLVDHFAEHLSTDAATANKLATEILNRPEDVERMLDAVADLPQKAAS